MDVWITRCRKQRKCYHCPDKIENHAAMVLGKMWCKSGSKRWAKMLAWHPQCWIDQGVIKMESRPIVESRGRRKTPITDEMRNARCKILRRRAAVVQRIRLEMERNGEERNIARLIHFGRMMENLREEISELGGVPKSWE